MLFEKKAPLNLIICPNCKSTGLSGWGRCRECRGMAMAHIVRHHLLYWGFPLTRYNLMLEHGRRVLNIARKITLIVLWLNFWIWFGFFIYGREAYKVFLAGDWGAFFTNLTGGEKTMFWLGVFCLFYLWYRIIAEKQIAGRVEHHDYDEDKKENTPDEGVSSWPVAFKIPRRHRLNIATTLTDEAKSALGAAYTLADKGGYNTVTPEHLFYALLSFNRVSNIFIRLGFASNLIQNRLNKFFEVAPKAPKSSLTMPLVSSEFQQVLFSAYEEAYNAHQEYVSVTELLVASANQSTALQEMLYDLSVDKQKLANVVEWARIRERLYRQYKKLRKASSHRSKYGLDKAMTAVSTPYLNRFSEDLTALAQFGYLENCLARDHEIEEIFRVVEGGGQNVLLVGDNGSGKRSIVEGLAQRMVEDDVPRRLKDKRLVRISVSALLAGTTPSGAVERLINIFSEVGHAGNVILFIHNIHELFGVTAGSEQGSLDVAGTMAEYLTGGRFLTLATTTSEEYGHHIVNSTLGNVFSKVEIKEMTEDQAVQVLESKVGTTEHKHQVFFSYDALEKAAQLSHKFIHEMYLPGSALEIMNEAASLAHNKKGANSLVSAEEVAKVVADKTGIPVTTVSADESTKLLKLEEEMHKRVVGQNEAVDAVANALRRARAQIRSTTKPIANFLFLGPTGVGKTELAKTIAEVYFGGEDRTVRLDMSEYQDKSSISRLIGAAGDKGSGVLTEAVRRRPFALLLLDEIEKADKDILNLFLQVMDDGRLTDSTGRVVDFTNVILIATSNAGTAYVSEQMKAGLSSEAIKERLLHGELAQYFRPEFLNRFDGIVLFKSLDREAIKKIAGFMLKRVAKDLDAKGVQLEVQDAALDFLAEVGFDPQFGARPMRRALQERVENKLAELLLSGKLKRKDVVVIGAGGEVRVK